MLRLLLLKLLRIALSRIQVFIPAHHDFFALHQVALAVEDIQHRRGCDIANPDLPGVEQADILRQIIRHSLQILLTQASSRDLAKIDRRQSAQQPLERIRVSGAIE